jgi:hypothetical protein
MFHEDFFGSNQRCISHKAADAPTFHLGRVIDLLAFIFREVDESLSPKTRLRSSP